MLTIRIWFLLPLLVASVSFTTKEDYRERIFLTWVRGNQHTMPAEHRIQDGTLFISNVRPDAAGEYICQGFDQSGNILFNASSHLEVINYGRPSETENRLPHTTPSPIPIETRSVPYGSAVVMECRTDLEPPVNHVWSRQGGFLPKEAVVDRDTLTIPIVQPSDAGTYICTAKNHAVKMDIPTVLVVKDVIKRFDQRPVSFISLPTLPSAYLKFSVEISFKPESPDGLILYNGQQSGGTGDFVSFGLNQGHPELRFDVGSGPAIIRSPVPVSLNQWHTVKIDRNRKEGSMYVDGSGPYTGTAAGRFQGLDLEEPLYIGGVPDFSTIHRLTGFSQGFIGCISRLVVGTKEHELIRDATSTEGLSSCDTCSSEQGLLCQNHGICQESNTQNGFVCICPSGFSGDHCEKIGEACFPGACSTGRCVNDEGGLNCICPIGRKGSRCDEELVVRKPAFVADGSYVAYPTPKALKRLKLNLRIKLNQVKDSIILYSAQSEEGRGDFTSLSINDKPIEFRYNVGSGTAIFRSNKELEADKWISVVASREGKEGSLSVEGEETVVGKSPGTTRGLNLITPIYVGGYNRERVKISPGVGLAEDSNGYVATFDGCVSGIEVSGLDLDVIHSVVDSANVEECNADIDDGGIYGLHNRFGDTDEVNGIDHGNDLFIHPRPEKNPCENTPCENGAICLPAINNASDYECHCAVGFRGRHCESTESLCESLKPCQNGGTCLTTSPNTYHCLCSLGYGGKNCDQKVELGESVGFQGDGYLVLSSDVLPHKSSNEIESIIIEFSTTSSDGILFWQGQTPETDGRGQDFLAIAVVDGHLEFSYELGSGPALITLTESRVDDGKRHHAVFHREGKDGSIELDGANITIGKSAGFLTMLNTAGNIYIGGLPNADFMTGGKYIDGFSGCIQSVDIQNNGPFNLYEKALYAVNAQPCSKLGDTDEVNGIDHGNDLFIHPRPEKNPCENTPCENGAICLPAINNASDYECHCAVGFRGRHCESTESLCESLKPCQNGGTCLTTSPNTYHCLCSLGYGGKNCDQKVELGESVGFQGDGYLVLSSDVLPHKSSNEIESIIIEFSTTSSDGILFWQGQTPETDGRGQDFLAIAVVDGHLEFSYELGSGPALITLTESRVDDGKRHHAVFHREGKDGSIELDGADITIGKSAGFLTMLNTAGNIYIGGLPNADFMTGGKYIDGFSGCIQSVDIQNNGPFNLYEKALYAVNAQPCSKFGDTDEVNGIDHGNDLFIHPRPEKNPCENTPCENGAICLPAINNASDYECHCAVGFRFGDTDEVNGIDHGNDLFIHPRPEKNPCENTPCENGAICLPAINNASDYECHCAVGFRGRHCESTESLCESLKPCQNGGTCLIPSPNTYHCLCSLGYGGKNCDQKVELGESVGFQGDGYLVLSSDVLPHKSSNEIESIIIEFSTTSSDGILFWQGQTPETDGRGQDFLAIAVVDGHLEFSYELGSGPALITLTESRVDDGKRHHAVFHREGKDGSIELDGADITIGKSAGFLTMLNTAGNIYIGGLPNADFMTGGKYIDGFSGCIQSVDIQNNGPFNLYEKALYAVNAQPCSKLGDTDEVNGIDHGNDLFIHPRPEKNPCENTPCENGAICLPAINNASDYECHCAVGFRGRHCESTESLCESLKPCQNGGTCLTTSPNTYHCLCSLGYGGKNCDQKVELGESVGFQGDGYLVLSSDVLPHKSSNEIESIIIEFSTTSSDGILFWQGQTPETDGRGQDFLAIAVVDGHLEFSYELGSGPALITLTESRVDDGKRHHAVFHREGKDGSIELDGADITIGKSAGFLTMLNTAGNIYIGGLPNADFMTGGKYIDGFSGCIQSVDIQNNGPFNLYEKALYAVNAQPCSKLGDTDEVNGIDHGNDLFIHPRPEKNPCENTPCENGAICLPAINNASDYECHCAVGFRGRHCESTESLCESLKPCQNGGTCLTTSPNTYHCLCSLGYGGKNCDQKVEFGESVGFQGDGYLVLSSDVLPHKSSNEIESIIIEFSTTSSDGILFWQGQTPETDGRGQDFLAIAVVDGHLEFSYELGSGPALITLTESRVDDGKRHHAVFHREGKDGSIELDGADITIGKSAGFLTMLNTAGNIYIGGLPNADFMTGGKYIDGFSGCIQSVDIQNNGPFNLYEKALYAVNAQPCSKRL